MLICTLVIGIVIGVLTSGIFFNKKNSRLITAPTKEYFNQKALNLLKPDERQLIQFEGAINKFSDKAYLIEKDNNFKMYNALDSLYIELKPALSQEQRERFEKRLTRINSIISK